MDVQMLGTGSAEGWPNPFCGCSSCNWARDAGEIRGQTSALIDGVVLVDCGPEVPRASVRHEASLSRVHTFVFTHAHPDHVGPMALLFRHWARRRKIATVIGPPAVIELCRPWVAPTDPVRFVTVEPNSTVVINGYSYTAMPATHEGADIGPAVIYAIEDSVGKRLLYACDTGPLSRKCLASLANKEFDIVLLEETFGDLTSHKSDHLDLVSFPRTLSELRELGAVTDQTDVVAVHLSHQNPRGDVLSARLAHWGARTVADGDFLGEPRRPTSGGRRTLVLGGARSGKSTLAESRLLARPHVTYVATAPSYPQDPEWQARIAAHRARRPASWKVVETTDVEKQLNAAGKEDVLLVDCLTLWLTGVLDETNAWDTGAAEATERISALVDAWRSTSATVVGVSNDVGAGVVPATPSGRLFRDLQGTLNTLIAQESDEVLLMVAGRAITL